jgi:DNA primase
LTEPRGPTPDEAKEQVRNAVDIVQIVGERVALRRVGRRYSGLCPFHQEKTPSFTVNPEWQIWHCFGCGKGGDVFSFLMELDKVTFPEALRDLADRAGIELPRREATAGSELRDRLHQANALARDFFRAELLTPAGAPARGYLAERGFEGEILERFEIGWAPDRWDGLLSALGKLLPVKTLEEAGLVLRRGDGSGHYDRFRNRVMFPVLTGTGRVAGFGARALAPDDTPKYLNSPETAVFRKGSLLFGLSIARKSIRERKQVLMTEGYLDAMRLHRVGLDTAVSACGTALTPDQARLLGRFEAEVVLLYDGDDAGIRAADRALEPLLSAGLPVRICTLPPGEDPDSFVRSKGASALRTFLEERAYDVPEFLARSALTEDASKNPSAEARVRRFVALLHHVGDPIRRQFLLRRGADVFRMDESVLLEAMRALPRTRGGGAPATRPAPAAPRGPGAGGPVPGAPASGTPPAGEGAPTPLDPVERELACRVLTEEGALAEVSERGGAAWFRHEGVRTLLQPWLQAGRPPYDNELHVLAQESKLTRALLSEHAKLPGRTHDVERREARELMDRLEDRRIRENIRALDQAIREAEGRRDEGSLGRLVAERRDLASKLHARTHPAIG